MKRTGLILFPLSTLLLLAISVHAQPPPQQPPFFSIDPSSPSLAGGFSPSDILGVNFTGPFISAEVLSTLMNVSGNIDALSLGTDSNSLFMSDWVAKVNISLTRWVSNIYYWSVDRGSVGSPTGGTNWSPVTFNPIQAISSGNPVQVQAAAGEAAGDIFVQIFDPTVAPVAMGEPRFNMLYFDEGRLGLVGAPPGPPIDDIDALASVPASLTQYETDIDTTTPPDRYPDKPVYYSVDNATAALLGVSPADILVFNPVTNATEVYATAQALGLNATDNIDALCILDLNQSRSFDTQDVVYLSLDRNSTSLAGVYSPADVFFVDTTYPFPGPPAPTDPDGPPMINASFFSLNATTDNLDALFCTWGDPGELFEPPVGGIWIPVNKLELLAPYIGLTIPLAVAVITVGYAKKRKRDTKINS